MDFVLLFLMAYGLAFGLQNNKARILTDRLKALRLRVRKADDGTETTFFQRLLICPYCTGFHTGWMAWLALRAPLVELDAFAALEAVGTAFAAAAVCYLLDTAAQLAEDASARLTSGE